MIASVAAYYSIIGLTAIFAASFWPIVIMASSLEVGKLVTASWLYRNWKTSPLLLRFYLTCAVIVLMFITSMGIFGFLSKAHLEQMVMMGGNNELRIEALQRRIATEESRITDAENIIAQLDTTVETLIEYDRIRGPDGAVAIREAQAPERDRLNASIEESLDRIEEFQDELLPLQQESLVLEAEVGPLKYIAELVYGEEEAANYFDQAVRWVIILLVSVFDPLAVVLLIAANMSLARSRESKSVKEDIEITNASPMPEVKQVTKSVEVDLTPVEVGAIGASSLAFTKKENNNKVIIDKDNIFYNGYD